MSHVSYGLFEDEQGARAALDAIETTGTPRRHFGVTIHKNRLDQDTVGVSESDAAAGAREGAAIAGILGAIAGTLAIGPLGLISGGALGALYGSIGGALAGAGAPDRTIERLSKQLAEGRTLVVVEAPSFESQEKADEVMRANGGRVEHKPFF